MIPTTGHLVPSSSYRNRVEGSGDRPSTSHHNAGTSYIESSDTALQISKRLQTGVSEAQGTGLVCDRSRMVQLHPLERTDSGSSQVKRTCEIQPILNAAVACW